MTPSEDKTITAEVRLEDGTLARVPLSGLTADRVTTGLPVSTPAEAALAAHGQSGTYWSFRQSEPLTYAGEKALAWLVAAEADPRVGRIVSRPFRLLGHLDNGTLFRWEPDFAHVDSDGSVVVDHLSGDAGWEVCDLVVAALNRVGLRCPIATPVAEGMVAKNLRVLALFRDDRDHDVADLRRVVDLVSLLTRALDGPPKMYEITRAVVPGMTERDLFLTVWHLLATGDLTVDLTRQVLIEEPVSVTGGRRFSRAG